LRHQLPKLPDIPYTSNNSSACAVLWCEASLPLADLFGAAVDYLSKERLTAVTPASAWQRKTPSPMSTCPFRSRAMAEKSRKKTP